MTNETNDLSIHFQGEPDEPWTLLDLCRLCGAIYAEHLYGSLSEERLKYILEPANDLFYGFEPGFIKADDISQDEDADRIAWFLYEGSDEACDPISDYSDVVAAMKRRACQQ